MKNRIEQLLKGNFEYESEGIRISVSELSFLIRKGERPGGSFTLENGSQRRMEGFVSAGSLRMACEPVKFQGIKEKIRYEFDTTGMEEGDAESGVITISSDVGEYRIPYHVEIVRSALRPSDERIQDVDSLLSMAKEDYQKACRMFLSDEFEGLLEEKNPELLSLYVGLKGKRSGYGAMEEFLKDVFGKEPVEIRMDGSGAEMKGPAETRQEEIVLHRKNWGYCRLTVRAEGDFLRLDRSVVTTEEFIGSTFRLEYLISPEKLHAGRNYGRIVIEGQGNHLVYEVTVTTPGRGKEASKRSLGRQKELFLTKRYLDFRLDRIPLEQWAEESTAALDECREEGIGSTALMLFRVQLLFAAGKQEEACLLLTELEGDRKIHENPETLGYYLYLTTLNNKDRSYVDYVEEQLQRLLGRNRENWRLQWCLLYVDKRYPDDPERKLETIRRQYLYGCRSRIMYLEGFQLVRKNPLLLKKLGEFEMALLRFICREGLLDEGIILQTGELAARRKEYSGRLHWILERCYEARPSRELTGIICSYLIKGGMTGEKYLTWYLRGVEADLRITGLYEHFVNSLPMGDERPLPQIVKMYFAYNNTLSYRRKAMIYANILANREADPRVFTSYRPVMEKFMVDQLAEGHITRELAKLYRAFLNPSFLNRRLAEKLAGILFTWEVRCSDPAAANAVVIHAALSGEQIAPFVNGRALVRRYTGDSRILIQDKKGNRSSVSIPFEAEPLLDSEELKQLALRLAPEAPEMVAYACGSANGGLQVNEENRKEFLLLLGLDELKPGRRKQVMREILDYYDGHRESPSLGSFLKGCDLEAFARTDKGKLLSLLTAEGMIKEAFALIRVLGPEKADPAVLVKICSRSVLDGEYEPDEMLTALCRYCVRAGKYDETMLSYLVRCYDGPVSDMKQIWQAGRQFDLDTYQLEEKILRMVVFMGCGGEQTEEIFESYRRSTGNVRLMEAYIISRAYADFVHGERTAEPVFLEIERRYQRGGQQQDVCLLALLRWYASLPGLTEERQSAAQALLEQFSFRGMPFAFYGDFPLALLRSFQLQDKVYAEYRANPEAVVTLSWYPEENGEKGRETQELMRNVFEGVFVKEFTLFYGETVHYRIQEEYRGRKKETGEMVLTWSDRGGMQQDTFYDLINRLAKAVENKDDKRTAEIVRTYREQAVVAAQLFPLV